VNQKEPFETKKWNMTLMLVQKNSIGKRNSKEEPMFSFYLWLVLSVFFLTIFVFAKVKRCDGGEHAVKWKKIERVTELAMMFAAFQVGWEVHLLNVW